VCSIDYSVADGSYRSTAALGAIVGWPSESCIVLDQWIERKLALLDRRTWQTRAIPYAPNLQRDDRLTLSAQGRTLAVERGRYQADIWPMRADAGH
jgi:hypothetical protein